jgi:tetratricopeptide (TPR) repeat protein
VTIGDWLKRKRGAGASAGAAIRRPDELITAFDERGREIQIKRSDWVTGVLGPSLEKAWNDADALYSGIVQALQDDFAAQVAGAAERLIEVDRQSERSCVIAGIVRMELGDLAGAERALQLSIDTHGPTGVVLTNLAKVLDKRGQKERSVATLRRAVELDPNQENGLMWWAALAKEERGEAGYMGALEEMVKVPGAWRPHLWLAREKLKQGERAPALGLYEHVLSLAADEPGILMAVTGHLGEAGALEDLVRLAAPRYRPEVHGPPAGMNIARALKLLGRHEEARAAVRRLQAMPWPPMASALAELEKEIVASALPRRADHVAKVGLVTFDAPLWTREMFDPTWLLPSPGEESPSVVLFTLADETRTGDAAQVQMTDDSGRLTRAIPLYLLEAIRLRLRARVRCAIMIVPGQGPAVLRQPFERAALEYSLPPSPSRPVLVAGSLRAGGLQLEVWEAGAAATAATITVDAPHTDVGALVARAEQALVAALIARGLRPDTALPAFYRPPPPEWLATYVSALEQLLYQLLAANGMVAAESLWNERGFFETYFALVEGWPDAPDSARLIGICGVLAARRYKSAILEPYRKIVLQWIDAAPAGSVLHRLAPAVFRQLGEGDRLETWLRTGVPSSDTGYAAWLERVKAGDGTS